MLKDVHAELSARRPREAINLFQRIIGADSLPASVSLREWVVSAIGRQGLSDLALAYATASCSYCSLGMRECSACDGTGRGDGGLVCRSCLGVRRRPCESCQGSGLASYGKCPDDLRPLVLSYRLCIAASEVARLVPGNGELASPATLKSGLLRTVNLNKLAGVLEAAAVELAGQQARGMISPARLERVKQQIAKLYGRLETAIRATLDQVFELTLLNAGSTSPDAMFYRWLARSDDFEGTALQRRAAARLASTAS